MRATLPLGHANRLPAGLQPNKPEIIPSYGTQVKARLGKESTMHTFRGILYGVKDLVRFHITFLVCLVLLGALAAGSVWLFRAPLRAWAYGVTGEEDWLAQVKGLAEYAGNLTRPQPKVDSDAPVQYTDVVPFGINTFLEQEVEVAKRERSLQMIRDAGFRWIRQEFPWEDIEIHGKGDFQDRRWEPYRSAWDKYDNIVALAGKYGLQIICRLDNPPAWSRADGNARGTLIPPDDYADFGDYVYAVVSRYRGQIRFYQIWNEPNLVREWGQVSARDYVNLLRIAYTRAKEADPDSVILAGALAATIELNGSELGKGINDFIYLQQMYDAGAAPYFDILSMQGYGLYSGPTDRRMRPRVLNFSRPLYIREIMVQNGDAHKPVWISELDWSPVPAGITPVYGRYDEATRARYVVEAYERMRQEWPWMGVASFWFFKRADDSERDQPSYYFRMVEPDFTALPVYEAMRAYTATHAQE